MLRCDAHHMPCTVACSPILSYLFASLRLTSRKIDPMIPASCKTNGKMLFKQSVTTYNTQPAQVTHQDCEDDHAHSGDQQRESLHNVVHLGVAALKTSKRTTFIYLYLFISIESVAVTDLVENRNCFVVWNRTIVALAARVGKVRVGVVVAIRGVIPVSVVVHSTTFKLEIGVTEF